MPKAGFKSITVAETVYDRFFDVYINAKDDLVMKGINSFSGYVTHILEEMMQKDKTFARYAPKIETIQIDDSRIILKDNEINRIVEISIMKNEPYCELCEDKTCRHIGFTASLPELYEIIGSKN